VDCSEPRALAKPPHTLGRRHSLGLNWNGYGLDRHSFEWYQRDKFASRVSFAGAWSPRSGRLSLGKVALDGILAYVASGDLRAHFSWVEFLIVYPVVVLGIGLAPIRPCTKRLSRSSPRTSGPTVNRLEAADEGFSNSPKRPTRLDPQT
jgi:hypothetical protein